ncbi:MAG: hypothetical protein JWR19_1178 [Pedosphaera sp.]|nr:hypothetical protein [Pedosphaera sp.]
MAAAKPPDGAGILASRRAARWFVPAETLSLTRIALRTSGRTQNETIFSL